ncbi:MAG: 50S ribosomal protein L35 [Candidatus Nomurabacteria bacterium]|nr:50S ribosomal protein L35 [Candidatus Nomurabacteria bacterium]
MSSAKTNKSLAKRLKITRTGKVLATKPGKGHLNAKQRRRNQLAGKRMNVFKLSNKDKGRHLPHA